MGRGGLARGMAGDILGSFIEVLDHITAQEQEFEAYRALQALRPHGIQVASNLQPESKERQRGEALPQYHATLIEQAMTAVKTKLGEDA